MSQSLETLHKNLNYLKEKGIINFSQIPSEIEEVFRISEASGYAIDHLLSKDLALTEKAHQANIKLLVLDVDGVLTDGSMFLTESGDEAKRFNAKDGMAIKKAIKQGIQVAIISNGSRKNAIEHRAQMLGIERVYVGKDKKLDILTVWLNEMNINLTEVAYIGDDINDIPVMEKIALSACPNNAVRDVLKTSDIILSRNGGDACVREFIENYLLTSLTD